jgi:5'-nucleotidase/UDP-sugar diphosphatase
MLARILCSTAILAAMGGAATADTTLQILHFNDLHSRIEPINRFDSTCNAEDDAAGECFGGMARIATAINSLRDENTIVVVGGDLFQGSLMYTTYKGDVEAEMMNAINLDVLALGNHEFDDGPENLARFVDMVDFPVIGGNLDLTRSDVLGGRIGDSVVLDVNGTQVGIVSSLTVDTIEIAAPGPLVIFQDEIDAMQADVDAMTEAGIDIIIAVTHVGFRTDMMIAEAVTGLDAIVGGHSNTYLSATDPDRDGAYPTFATNPDGALVPVVQAYAYSKYLGVLELNFDDAGNVIYAGGNTMLLDASVVPDPIIAARVAELAEPISEAMSIVVAETSEPIEGDRSFCRAVECQMGNLVADAMLDRTRDQGVTIAIQNGGGLRASIDGGDVTMGEILTVLPFQNMVATFQLSGANVIVALENAVSEVEDGAGRFAQVAGIRYTWDAAAEPGSRVVSVEVETADGFAAIDPETVYGVATNNYMRGGGDGYSVFAVEGMNAYDFGPGLEQVVADYMAGNTPYTPFVEGRITRLN